VLNSGVDESASTASHSQDLGQQTLSEVAAAPRTTLREMSGFHEQKLIDGITLVSRQELLGEIGIQRRDRSI